MYSAGKTRQCKRKTSLFRGVVAADEQFTAALSGDEIQVLLSIGAVIRDKYCKHREMLTFHRLHIGRTQTPKTSGTDRKDYGQGLDIPKDAELVNSAMLAAVIPSLSQRVRQKVPQTVDRFRQDSF